MIHIITYCKTKKTKPSGEKNEITERGKNAKKNKNKCTFELWKIFG